MITKKEAIKDNQKKKRQKITKKNISKKKITKSIKKINRKEDYHNRSTERL